MLDKPANCQGCPLQFKSEGWSGFFVGHGYYDNIHVISGPLTATELEKGEPLTGDSGLLLERTLNRASLSVKSFNRVAAVRCHPHNAHEVTPELIALCGSRYNEHNFATAKVIITLGQEAYTQLTGDTTEILDVRGYPIYDSCKRLWIMPTVHPQFMREGNSNYGAVLVHDFTRALELRNKVYTPPDYSQYTLDPSPDEAYTWASQALEDVYNNHARRITFDIETPWKRKNKGSEDGEVDWNSRETTKIGRISFSHRTRITMSIPWAPAYMPAVNLLLNNNIPKGVWNKPFDVPIIRDHGILIGGDIHDGMVMWHVYQSDLPKKLGFAATFLVPEQERWKHLSHTNPQLYSAIDSDVENQALDNCEKLLKQNKMWHVYQEQVFLPDKALNYMSEAGMPVDPVVRLESAEKLDKLIKTNFQAVQGAVPEVLKKLEVKNVKVLQPGMVRTVTIVYKEVKVCRSCNAIKVTKTKHTKKACLKGSPDIQKAVLPVDVPAVVHPFNVGSWQQILKYSLHMGHKLVYKGKGKDRKPTTDDKAIKKQQLRYPDDPLYPLVLEHRKLDKLAGTYVGRLEEPIEGEPDV